MSSSLQSPSVPPREPAGMSGERRRGRRWLAAVCSVATLAAGVVIFPNSATATPSVAVLATQDSAISQGSAGSNYSSGGLRVRDSSADWRSLVQFDLTGLSGPASVSLRLTVTDASYNGGAVYAGSSTTWNESTVSWSTAPTPVGSALAQLGAVAVGQVIDVSLGSVPGNGRYVFIVAAGSGNSVIYASSESATGPVLVVTPATTTTTALATTATTALATTTTTAPATTTTTAPAPPPSAVSTGIWINASEIAARPATGQAWDAMKAAALTSWGTPTIADQDSTDDTDTLAGAIVAVRLNDDALRSKVRDHLAALVTSHPYDRVLGLARQLPSYVIAADLVGLEPSARLRFEAFLREAMSHQMAGHSGGTDLRSTARLSPNNWGTMSRAAMAAADVYLGDFTDLAVVANTQRAWLGESVPNELRYTSTTWHSGSPQAGVNPVGAVRDGHPLDGVQPEDQRRTGEYTWPAPQGSYPHEALQGAVLASVILDRAGALPFATGNNALIRAEAWLSGPNANPPSSDDRNTPYMLNRYGASFATGSTSAAKNIAWADWAYA